MNQQPTFSKVLAKYYRGWFKDCYDSAIYCRERGNNKEENEYLTDMQKYYDIIINNWDAIEFFSIKDNAFLLDAALPAEFRGYK